MFSKDLLIGILVSYIVLDVCLGVMVYKKNPDVLHQLKDTITSDSTALCIVFVALVIGCVSSNCFGQFKLKLF